VACNVQEFNEVMEIACAGSFELAAQHRSALWEALTRHFFKDLKNLDPRAPAKIVQAALCLDCSDASVCQGFHSSIKQLVSKEKSLLSSEELREQCLAIVRSRMHIFK
jgi:hypothetical protein